MPQNFDIGNRLLLFSLLCRLTLPLSLSRPTDTNDSTSKVTPSSHEHSPFPSSRYTLLHVPEFIQIGCGRYIGENGLVYADLRGRRGVKPRKSGLWYGGSLFIWRRRPTELAGLIDQCSHGVGLVGVIV